MPYKDPAKQAANDRERYERLKAAGMCRSHPEQPAVEGQTRCKECVRRMSAYNRERRKEQAAYDRERYERLKAAGMCRSHPEQPAVEGRSCCEECVRRRAVNGRKRWAGLSPLKRIWYGDRCAAARRRRRIARLEAEAEGLWAT